MLEARRSGQDYFLLHDPASLQGNRESILRLQQTLSSIRDLQPEEQSTIEDLLNERRISQQRFGVAVSDRKSTRLNSSHLGISYAVFCLKKKTHRQTRKAAFPCYWSKYV